MSHEQMDAVYLSYFLEKLIGIGNFSLLFTVLSIQCGEFGDCFAVLLLISADRYCVLIGMVLK
jgi:hypothetical protein